MIFCSNLAFFKKLMSYNYKFEVYNFHLKVPIFKTTVFYLM
ncbi:Uncharacterised protein [Legionella maceachernii]|nr:hypothetical protein SAMN02745128_00310 [Legionella maceachernii]SUP03708.1 Uncharacterised protein [Legionella maceachernii]